MQLFTMLLKIICTLSIAATTMDVAVSDETPSRRNISEIAVKLQRVKRDQSQECADFVVALAKWHGLADDAKDAGCLDLKEPAEKVRQDSCELTGGNQNKHVPAAAAICTDIADQLTKIKDNAVPVDDEADQGEGTEGTEEVHKSTAVIGGQAKVPSSVPGSVTFSNKMLVYAVSWLMVMFYWIQGA